MGSGYYLGIFEGHADPAAAIAKNGCVIAFAEEERFIRQKHAWGIYPANALKFCLSAAGIDPENAADLSKADSTFARLVLRCIHRISGLSSL